MQVTTIGLIFLRLMALHWVFTGLISMSGFSGAMVGVGYFDPWHLLYLIPSALYFIFAALVWFLAPVFSRVVARGHDESTVDFKEITEQHFYIALLVGLGLYFVLASLPQVFNWLHYLLIYQVMDESSLSYYSEPGGGLYGISESALKVAGGVVLIVNARRFANRLAKSPPMSS